MPCSKRLVILSPTARGGDSDSRCCGESWGPRGIPNCVRLLTILPILSTNEGVVEQIPISVAYQATFMSVTSTATPKHRGLTFRRQFNTLMLHPETPIATITGWNEWISGRRPCDSHPSCPCSEHPHGCFTDEWDVEYSRDIEPARNEMGDFYYRLMAACIELFREGGICDGSRPDHLCCRPWSAGD